MSTFVPAQRDQALEKANAVRFAIVRVRANVGALNSREGRDLVALLLEHPSGVVPSMRVGTLLTAIHRVGRQKSASWLLAAGGRSADRKVRDLTERQRFALAAILRGKQSR